MRTHTTRFIRQDRGQSMIEFAVVLPLLLVVVLGLIEVSYALYDQHVVTKLTREGSNLISRDTSLQDAATALRTLSVRPVDLAANSKVIFSVVMNVGATGSSNYGQPILYQRYEYRAISGTSALSTSGGSHGRGPDFTATNPDNDTALRVSESAGQRHHSGRRDALRDRDLSRHTLITPFNRFGVTVPSTLYSIAYF